MKVLDQLLKIRIRDHTGKFEIERRIPAPVAPKSTECIPISRRDCSLAQDESLIPLIGDCL